MTVDLSNIKTKVKLKDWVPKEDQIIIPGFEMYADMEIDITAKQLFDKLGMTVDGYKKMVLERDKEVKKTTTSYNFNKKTETPRIEKMIFETKTALFSF